MFKHVDKFKECHGAKYNIVICIESSWAEALSRARLSIGIITINQIMADNDIDGDKEHLEKECAPSKTMPDINEAACKNCQW